MQTENIICFLEFFLFIFFFFFLRFCLCIFESDTVESDFKKNDEIIKI